MAISALDPRSALIVIDLQRGIVAMVADLAADIVRRAASLAQAFRVRQLPVVLVNVAGMAPGRTEQQRGGGAAFPADFAELVPELDRQPDDHAITKHSWGAFTGTGLDATLRAQGVTQVVVVGVATSIGVESTARQAHELGYNVALVTDAMTDLHAEAHANSLTRIFPRLGETGSTAEVIALLEAGHG